MSVRARDAHWLKMEKYQGETPPQYYKDLERLERGEPIAYVIGWIPFLRARINLDDRPLIPRPETEYWASEAFRIIEARFPHIFPFRFADLFAGSGCIGISALMRFPKAQCTFIDIGFDECASTAKNIKNNVYHAERAKVIHGDATTLMTGPYHTIFANPPYIADQSTVDESVYTWEPHRALYANEEGLGEIKRLLQESAQHLTEDGVLFCEFAQGQHEAIRQLEDAAHWDITYHDDQYGITRWFEAYPKHHD